MTRLFEEAVREAQMLSPDEQDAIAGAMFEFLGQRPSRLTDAQRAEVRRRQADPNQVLISFEDAMKRIKGFGSLK